MAASSPLDTLKHLVLRVDSLLSMATDRVAGSSCDTDHEDDLDVVDAARREMFLMLAEHVDGIGWDIVPTYTPAAMRQAHTYDDGSPVKKRIDLMQGAIADFYPRLDGDETIFVNTVSTPLWAPLYLVPATEPSSTAIAQDRNLESADCPIEWCVGNIGDHGGDGTSPEHWLHRGAELELATIGTFEDFQIGSGARAGSVDISFEAEYTSDELREFVKQLRGIADMLTHRASLIDS